jgi:hypothetical protein
MSDEQPKQPPLTPLPRANRSLVEQYVRSAMAGAPKQAIAEQVSAVLMADALGRAIHSQRGPVEGRVFADLNRCVRLNNETDQIEEVPYGYEDPEYRCDCEELALKLVAVMKDEQAHDEIVGLVVGPDLPTIQSKTKGMN